MFQHPLDLTRENYTSDEIQAALDERLLRRRRIVEEVTTLEEYIWLINDDDTPELVEAKERRARAIARIATEQQIVADTEKDLNERQAELLASLTELQGSLKQVDDEIKAFLLRQTFGDRKGPYQATLHGFTVKRSRTNKTAVSYDAAKVLEAFPQLRDYALDGDPLVESTINPGIADRMLADDTVASEVKEALRAARAEVFPKNPSVTIETAKEGSDA